MQLKIKTTTATTKTNKNNKKDKKPGNEVTEIELVRLRNGVLALSSM